MQNPKPQALLFDLGGVDIDIDFDRAFTVWARYSKLPQEDIKKLFRFDDQYQRHERGENQASDYYDHLATTLLLDTDHAHIANGWNSIYVGKITETVGLVST